MLLLCREGDSAMMICPRCKRLFDLNSRYCSRCGLELVDMSEREGKIDNLMTLCADAIEYLQNNFHPHTTVIMEVDGIRVEEALASRVIEYERS